MKYAVVAFSFLILSLNAQARRSTEIVEPATQSQNVTAVFSDSQFTASQYGINLVKNCLNSSHIDDASRVEFYSAPGAGTMHLNRSIRNAAPVYRYNDTARTYSDVLNGKTNDHYPSRFLNEDVLPDPNVNRVVLALGVNDINFDRAVIITTHWESLVKKIIDAGKQCVVSLPPLIQRGDSRNSTIIRYNRSVSEVVSAQGCTVVDTSNTLSTSPSDYNYFYAGDRLHYGGSAAQPTCEAFNRVLQPAGTPEVRVAEAADTAPLSRPSWIGNSDTSRVVPSQTSVPQDEELPSFMGQTVTF